jgi:hypothetical protein
MTDQEIKATSVVSMEIEAASAKVRAENVGDDEIDGDHPVWAGVIPVQTVIGVPLSSPVLPVEQAYPGHLAPFAQGRRLDVTLAEAQAIYEQGVF